MNQHNKDLRRDMERIRPFHGIFKDGYTEDQVALQFGRLERTTGIELACLWDFRDDWGFGGNSEFLIRWQGSAGWNLAPSVFYELFIGEQEFSVVTSIEIQKQLWEASRGRSRGRYVGRRYENEHNLYRRLYRGSGPK